MPEYIITNSKGKEKRYSFPTADAAASYLDYARQNNLKVDQVYFDTDNSEQRFPVTKIELDDKGVVHTEVDGDIDRYLTDRNTFTDVGYGLGQKPMSEAYREAYSKGVEPTFEITEGNGARIIEEHDPTRVAPREEYDPARLQRTVQSVQGLGDRMGGVLSDRGISPIDATQPMSKIAGRTSSPIVDKATEYASSEIGGERLSAEDAARMEESPEYRDVYWNIRRKYGMTPEEYATLSVDNINERIEEALDIAEDLREEAIADQSNWYVDIHGNRLNAKDDQIKATIRAIKRAQRDLNDSRTKYGEKDGWHLGKRFWDGGELIAKLTPIYNMISSLESAGVTMGQAMAAGKMIEDPERMTPEQKLLLSLTSIQQSVAQYQQDMGGKHWASGVGEVLQEMPEFMMGMPLAKLTTKAVTKGATKGLAKLAGKAIAETAEEATETAAETIARRALDKATGWARVKQVASDGIGAWGKSFGEAAIGAPTQTLFYRSLADEALGQYQVRPDGSTIQQVTPAWERVYRAWLGTALELHSEDMGMWIGKGLNALGRRMANVGFVRGLMRVPAARSPLMEVVRKELKVADPLSEALGEVYGDAIQPLFTGDLDWSQTLADPDYWLTTVVSSAGVSVAMELPSIMQFKRDADRVNKYGMQMDYSLAVMGEDLREQLVAAVSHNSIEAQTKALANIDWKNVSRQDMAAAMDYVNAYVGRELYYNSYREAERQTALQRQMNNLLALSYRGESGYGNTMSTIKATAKPSSGLPLNAEYYIISGDITQQGNQMLNVIRVDQGTPTREVVFADQINIGASTDIADELAKQYDLMFGEELAREGVVSISQRIAQMRAEGVNEETIREVVSEDSAYHEYKEGDVVTDSQTGEPVTINEQTSTGEYIATKSSGERIAISYDQIADSGAYAEQAIERERTSGGVKEGDVVSFLDRDGEMVEGAVQQILNDGRIYVSVQTGENNGVPTYATQEITPNQIIPAEAQPAQLTPTEQVAEEVAADATAEVQATEQTAPAEVPIEPQPAEVASTADPRAIPTLEDGSIDYDAIEDPQQFIDLYGKNITSEELMVDVTSFRDDAQQNVERLRNEVASAKTPNEKKLLRDQINIEPNRAAKYQAVLDLLTPATPIAEQAEIVPTVPEVAPAAAEVSKFSDLQKSIDRKAAAFKAQQTRKARPNPNVKEINALYPDGIHNMPPYIRALAAIATGTRFVWNSRGPKRGIGAELGFLADDGERKVRIGILARAEKGGVYFDEFVERLWHNEDGNREEDIDDVRNAVIDALRDANSPAKAMQILRESANINTEPYTEMDQEDFDLMVQYNQEQATLNQIEEDDYYWETISVTDEDLANAEKIAIEMWLESQNNSNFVENLQSYDQQQGDTAGNEADRDIGSSESDVATGGVLMDQGSPTADRGDEAPRSTPDTPDGARGIRETRAAATRAAQIEQRVAEIDAQLEVKRKEYNSTKQRIGKEYNADQPDLFGSSDNQLSAASEGGVLFDIQGDYSKQNISSILSSIQADIDRLESEKANLLNTKETSIAQAVETERLQAELDIPEEQLVQTETTPRGTVDMDTLQLTMSDEEFNSLVESGDVERMNGYLKELDDTLVINDQSPFKGQQELREEFKRLKEQYGGEDNIPTDVMEDINARYKPYAELSRKVYDRKYALEDRLRSAEVQVTQTAKKEEAEAKETHQATAFNGFLANKTALGASNAEKQLSKRVNIEGKPYTIAEYVENAVQSGKIELRTSEVPKYKGVSRRKWNQMDAAQQQAEQERIKNGGTVTEYYINDYNLGKTAYDYAQYLQAKAEAQKTAEPEWLQKVPNDGRDFIPYIKVAGANKYSPVNLSTGSIVGLLRASLVKREKLQHLVEELPKLVYDGTYFQIRDTKGKIYYSSEPIESTQDEKKAATKLTTLKTVSGAEVRVPINLYKYVSTDKTRAYTGVYFDPEGFVVATDGHNMIAVKHDVAEADAEKFISKAGDVASMIFNWRGASMDPTTKRSANIDFTKAEKQIGGKKGNKSVIFNIDGEDVGFPAKAIHALADFQRAFGGEVFIGDMTAGKVIMISSGDNYAMVLQQIGYADPSQAVRIPIEGLESAAPAAEGTPAVIESVESTAVETPTEPTPKKSKAKAKSSEDKIEDFGEKIGGARKDVARARLRDAAKLSIKDLEVIKDPDKILSRKAIVKYTQEGVMTNQDAISLLALNMVARQSAAKGMLMDKYRSAALQWERGENIEVLITEQDIEARLNALPERARALPNARERIIKDLEFLLLNPYNDYKATYEALDYPFIYRDLKGVFVRYGEFNQRYYVVRNISATRGWSFSTMGEAIKRIQRDYPPVEFEKEKTKTTSTNKEDRIGNIKVVKDDRGYYRLKSKNIPGNIYLSGRLYSKSEAEKYLQDNAEMLIEREAKMTEALMGSNIGMVERVGVDYRNGRDITPEEFQSTFGFRGVEFGNWVPQAERQMYLNKSYDAIKDFCAIVGISPKAFSLGGRLGLAFGARGKSGALAHYEPMKEVINLTRMKGAGSLAHEWFHALDNYIARSKSGDVTGMATERFDAVRQELSDVFRRLVSKMNTLAYSNRSKNAGDYWGEVTERVARLFQNYIYNRLATEEAASPLLVRKDALFDETGQEVEDFVKSTWPYPSERENEEMKPYFDELFSTLQEKVDEQGNVVLFQRGDFPEMPNTEANRRAYKLIREKLRKKGIEVHEVSEEMANAMASLIGAEFATKRKSATETVLPEDESSFKGTAISTADGAKILKNLDNLANKYQELSNRPWTFIGDVANALGISMPNKTSKYGIFEAMNGNEITIRLSDHNATVSNLDGVGENNAISIVISRKPNNGIANDGNAHIVEYYYPASKIQKADGKPLVDIITSIKQALYSGEYEDITGLAEREEVNLSNAEYQIVYHGSGAKFDRFDHSFMGTGEGAQAYGYGTYVTQVEGIGKTYAKSVRNSSLSLSYKGVKVDTEGHYNPWRIILDMYNDSRGKLRDMRAKAERYESLAEDDSQMKPVWKEVVRILKDDVRAGDLAVAPTRVLYSIEIPDSNGEYLQWEKTVSKYVRKKLIESVTEGNFGFWVPDHLREASREARAEYWMKETYPDNPHSGEAVYNLLRAVMGSDQAASAYLRDNGFVGIEYPAQYRSGGRADNAKNYVIFNENDLKIIDRVELFQDSQGKIYGWAVGGEIYLTPDGLNANTAIHEYSHLWVEALRKKDSKKWGEIKSQLQATPFWQQVIDDPNYERIRENEDAVASEVLARLTGKNGAARLSAEAQRIIDAGNGSLSARIEATALVQRVKRLLRDLWAWVARNIFGVTNEAAISQLSDMIVDDLLDETPLTDAEGSPFEAMFIGELGANVLDIEQKVSYRMANMDVAMQMEQAGKSPFDIKIATGWERGADGEWRYEISDAEAHLNIEAMAELNQRLDSGVRQRNADKLRQFEQNNPSLAKKRQEMIEKYSINSSAVEALDEVFELTPVVAEFKLRDLFDYDEAYEAYPQLMNTRVRVIDGMRSLGAHWGDNIDISLEVAQIPARMRATLLHEIQHSIQSIEGFAAGGNKEVAQKLMREMEQEVLIFDFAGLVRGELQENPDLTDRQVTQKVISELKERTGLTREELESTKRIPTTKQRAEALAAARNPELYEYYWGVFQMFNAALDDEGNIDSMKAYRNLMGEVEARNTTSRRNMTAEQRRSSLGSTTEDVNRGVQIYRSRQGDDSESLSEESKYSSRVETLSAVAHDVAAKLNAPIRVITDINDVPRARQSWKGWWQRGESGEQIVVVVPNNIDTADTERTILHEAVAHYGLRKLLGESQFNLLLDTVLKSMTEEEVQQRMRKYGTNDPMVVADEYIAEVAEGNVTPSMFERVVSAVRAFLRDVLGLSVQMTDNDIRYLLWQSKNALEGKSAFGRAMVMAQGKPLADMVAEEYGYARAYTAEEQQIIDNAQRNGTYLKAPNGKPTNLTPKQWVQARTKAFKRWFGDWESDPDNASKIVDANGEPLVVWHGGSFAINDFTPNGTMHFGTKVAALQRVLDQNWGYGNWEVIRNTDGTWGWKYTDPNAGEYEDEDYSRQSDKYFTSPIEALEDATGSMFDYVVRPYFLNIRNEERVDDMQDDDGWDNAVSNAIEMGSDGLVYSNDYEDEGNDSFVAFYPTQIKSAEINSGEFDPTDPDIRARRKDFLDAEGNTTKATPMKQAKEVKPEREFRANNLFGRFFETFWRYTGASQVVAGKTIDGLVIKAGEKELARRIKKGEELLRKREAPFVSAFVKKKIGKGDAMAAFQKLSKADKLQLSKVITGFNPVVDYMSAENRSESQGEYALKKYFDGFIAPLNESRRRMREVMGVSDQELETYVSGESSLERHNSGTDALSTDETKAWSLKKVEGIVTRFRSRLRNNMELQLKQQGANALSEAEKELLGEDLIKKLTEEGYDSLSAGEQMAACEAPVEVLWERIRALNNEHLNILLRAGRYSHDDIERIKSHDWRYYVPMFKQDLNVEGLIDPAAVYDVDVFYGTPSAPSLKPALGRDTKSQDVFRSMYQLGQRCVVFEVRNRVARSLYDFTIWANDHLGLFETRKYWHEGITYQTKTASGKWVDEDTMPSREEREQMLATQREIATLNRERLDISRQINRLSSQIEEVHSEQAADLIDDALRGLVNRKEEILDKIVKLEADRKWRAKKSNFDFEDPTSAQAIEPNRTVRVWIDGREHRMVFADPDIARAVNGNKNGIVKAIEWFGRLVGPFTRFRAQMNTQYSPDFIVSNTLRDYQHALLAMALAEQGDITLSFAGNYFRHLGDVFRSRGINYNPLSEAELKGRIPYYSYERMRSAYIAAKVRGEQITEEDFDHAYRDEVALNRRYLEEVYGKARVRDTFIDAFQRYGGATGFIHQLNSKQIEKQLREAMLLKEDVLARRYVDPTTPFRLIRDVISRVSESMEDITRFATFMAHLDHGASVERAAQEAKEVTTNFNRRGELATGLGSLYMFFNASVQGSAQVMRLIKQHPRRAVVVLPLYALLGFMQRITRGMLWKIGAATGIKALFFDDDDEERPRTEDQLEKEKAIRDYMYSDNLIIVLDRTLDAADVALDGIYLRIPQPNGFRAAYKVGVELAEVAMGEQRWDELPESLISTLAGEFIYGFGDTGELTSDMWRMVIPSAVQPISDLLLNKDFVNRTIYNEREYNPIAPAYTVAKSNTPSLYIDASRILNNILGTDTRSADYNKRYEKRAIGLDVPPEAIKYLVGEMFGGVGTFANRMWTTVELMTDGEKGNLAKRDIPFVNRVVGEFEPENVWPKYKSLTDQIEAAWSESSGFRAEQGIDMRKSEWKDPDVTYPYLIEHYKDNPYAVEMLRKRWLLDPYFKEIEDYTKSLKRLGEGTSSSDRTSESREMSSEAEIQQASRTLTEKFILELSNHVDWRAATNEEVIEQVEQITGEIKGKNQ